MFLDYTAEKYHSLKLNMDVYQTYVGKLPMHDDRRLCGEGVIAINTLNQESKYFLQGNFYVKDVVIKPKTNKFYTFWLYNVIVLSNGYAFEFGNLLDNRLYEYDTQNKRSRIELNGTFNNFLRFHLSSEKTLFKRHEDIAKTIYNLIKDMRLKFRDPIIKEYIPSCGTTSYLQVLPIIDIE